MTVPPTLEVFGHTFYRALANAPVAVSYLGEIQGEPCWVTRYDLPRPWHCSGGPHIRPLGWEFAATPEESVLLRSIIRCKPLSEWPIGQQVPGTPFWRFRQVYYHPKVLGPFCIMTPEGIMTPAPSTYPTGDLVPALMDQLRQRDRLLSATLGVQLRDLHSLQRQQRVLHDCLQDRTWPGTISNEQAG